MTRLRRPIASTLALTLLGWSLLQAPAAAAIVFLKGEDEPIRGFLRREDDQTVVIDQLLSDGSTTERTIPKSEIEDLLKTVSPERLAALQPDQPDQYREYAEELAEKRKDPEAHFTAIRLYLIAAYLAPERLGRSCLLGMVPLARDATEERRFRAMAYLLDPAHDEQLLTDSTLAPARQPEAPPRQAEFALRALRLLRQGKRNEALLQARRVRMEDQLPALTDRITYEEFEQACARVCPHCDRGKQECPQCQGKKIVAGKSCAACGAGGKITCPHCGGNYRENPLSPALLQKIIQVELDWLPAATPLTPSPAPPRDSWSISAEQGHLASFPPLTLETLTQFDPRQNRYRDGQWST